MNLALLKICLPLFSHFCVTHVVKWLSSTLPLPHARAQDIIAQQGHRKSFQTGFWLSLTFLPALLTTPPRAVTRNSALPKICHWCPASFRIKVKVVTKNSRNFSSFDVLMPSDTNLSFFLPQSTSPPVTFLLLFG